MKTFKEFIKESCNFPVVSIDNTKVGIGNSEALNELNKNLSTSLSVGFVNLYGAFEKAKKILSMYGIELPKPEIEPDWSSESGNIKIVFGTKNISGETLDGKFKLDMDPKQIFAFDMNYSRENGIYNVEAEVSKI